MIPYGAYKGTIRPKHSLETHDPFGDDAYEDMWGKDQVLSDNDSEDYEEDDFLYEFDQGWAGIYE